ncbi:MAG: hypothetical protein CMH64_01220 [Nanoarchaeota archaeon]|nr:hypothetical protein [Nanoarchaeota archaeon]|tara:strand:- start:1111 stop:1326 length:216 start_codon:yes stop_codon:yes gene_type:complete
MKKSTKALCLAVLIGGLGRIAINEGTDAIEENRQYGERTAASENLILTGMIITGAAMPLTLYSMFRRSPYE